VTGTGMGHSKWCGTKGGGGKTLESQNDPAENSQRWKAGATKLAGIKKPGGGGGMKPPTPGANVVPKKGTCCSGERLLER